MNDPLRDGQADEARRVGLCASCTHAQVITSARGSRFFLCRMAVVDPRFPKYPTLPVLVCTGFEPSTVEVD